MLNLNAVSPWSWFRSFCHLHVLIWQIAHCDNTSRQRDWLENCAEMAVIPLLHRVKPAPSLSSHALEVGQWSTQNDASRHCRKYQDTQIYSSVAHTHTFTHTYNHALLIARVTRDRYTQVLWHRRRTSGGFHQTSGAASASSPLLLNEALRWLLVDVLEGKTGRRREGTEIKVELENCLLFLLL